MLRIGYKGRETKFEFRGIKKAHIKETVAAHRALYVREQVMVDGQPVIREIPITDLVVEWQDGDGEWKDDAPTEAIPVT